MLRLALTVLLALTATAQAADERRVAVIVGHHDGGEGTRPLRYANADAERLHRIFTTIGGIAPADAVLLRDPTVTQLEAALAAADEKANGGVMIFYYSGHAKDGALRLGETRLPLDALREQLGALNARVKIAILDSCKSGEMIRTKGGTVVPAFEVNAEPVGPRGLAVLSSSAADEDSQESDRLGASFFTHYLASGLLGDADTSGDGKVTLQEAYGYAYSRTVAQTAEARAGLQHPTYAYSLAGAGEVWLSDVAKANSTLVLPLASAGSYVIVDAARRTLVAEVEKSAGTLRKVALPAGRYEVKRRDGDGALFARLLLADGDVVTLEEGAMERVTLARNMTKGADWAGELALVRPTRWTVAGGLGRQWFFAGRTREELFPNLPLVGLELELRDRYDASSTVTAFDLATGSAALPVQIGSLTIATQITQLTGGFSYLKELGRGALQPYFGARLSFIAVNRTFPPADGGIALPSQLLFTMAPGLVAGVNWEASRRLALGLRVRASYLAYRSEDDLSLGYADLGLLLKWEL